MRSDLMENFPGANDARAGNCSLPIFSLARLVYPCTKRGRVKKKNRIHIQPSSPLTQNNSRPTGGEDGGRRPSDAATSGRSAATTGKLESNYRRPAGFQALAASICRKSLQFLQMDDQGRMIEFGMQGLDDHDFSQRTTIPRPNIGHHQDTGLDDLEFTQRATGHRPNIGRSRDNELDDLEFSQRSSGCHPNFGTQQRSDDPRVALVGTASE